MFGFDLGQVGTATMVLFAVVDIIGSLPMILDLKQKVGKIEPEKASIVALEMILGIKLYKDEMAETASVVPLAFPIIAGAGTMTSLISLRSEYEKINIIIAIVINIIVVYVILKNTGRLERFLGASGISIIRKVFGIILLAIAVKLFKTNVGL